MNKKEAEELKYLIESFAINLFENENNCRISKCDIDQIDTLEYRIIIE